MHIFTCLYSCSCDMHHTHTHTHTYTYTHLKIPCQPKLTKFTPVIKYEKRDTEMEFAVMYS